MESLGRELFEARLDDAISESSRGCLATVGFLSPGECRRAERILRSRGVTRALFWGGYSTAERKFLFLPPDYLEDFFPTVGMDFSLESHETALEMTSETIAAFHIRGSGYRTLTHRDYLGSLLGLGLSREVLGDIAVQNGHEAVVFCAKHLVSFLCEQLTKVANDTVHGAAYVLDGRFTDGRRYAPISTTVASMRLDCVLSGVTDLSREAAQRAIRSGTVELNYEVEEKVDATVDPPATLSARGIGKFEIRSVDGETRKGRLRLRADKLI